MSDFAVTVRAATLDDVDTIIDLHQIHVDPYHWRRGVGRALHAECLRVWHATGVRVVRLWAWDFNTRAIAFYASHGWRADGAVRADDLRVGQWRLGGYRLDVS